MDQLDPARDEIQAAVRKAHVLSSRGDDKGAQEILQAAIEKYPEHPEAKEAKADALAAQGKLTEAKDLYAEVIAANPGRVATERKHAELVLRLAEDNFAIARSLDRTNISDLMNPAGARRTTGTASFLSLLAPGFGQIYNGDLIKGVVMLAVAAILVVLLFTVGYLRGIGMTGFGWATLVMLLALYVASILDAAVSAQKAVAPPRRERPVPPSDKPFE